MSAIDEHIAKYREFSQGKRYLILLLIGLIPGAFNYTDSIEYLEEELNTAQNLHRKKRTQYNKAKKKKDSLAKLEEQLTSTEIQLKDASSRLPDVFVIDKILQKIAMISSEIGIRINRFDPMKAIPSKTAFKYAQLPIEIQMTGTYAQIATFFDKIAHLKLLIHIKDLEIATEKGSSIPKYLLTSLKTKGSLDSDSEAFKQKWVRKHAVLNARAKIVIYRSLSEIEQKRLNEVIAIEMKKSKSRRKRKKL